MKEIDRRLRVTEGLLRHLIVRVDEHERKADRVQDHPRGGFAPAPHRPRAAA